MANEFIGNPQTAGLVRRSKYLEDAIKGLQNTPQSVYDTPAGTWGSVLSKAILGFSANDAASKAEAAQKADNDRLTSAILGTPEQTAAADLGKDQAFDLTPKGFDNRVADTEATRLRAISEMGGPMAALQYQQGQAATKKEDDRWNKTFGFQQDRATVQDNQFDRTFDANRDDAARSADQWRMGYEQGGEQFGAKMAQDANQFDKTYGLSQQELALKRQELADKRAAAAAAASGNPVFEGPQLATIYNKSMDALEDAKTAQSDLDTIANTAKQFLDVVGDDNWIQGSGWTSDLMQAGSFKTTELKALTDRIAPLMRKPGSGSSSDTDVAMFRNSIVNVNNTPEANKRFAQGAVAMAGRNQQYIDFLNQAIDPRDPQSRQKADRLWGLYKKDVPLFDQKTGDVNAKPPTFSAWLEENMGGAPQDDISSLVDKYK